MVMQKQTPKTTTAYLKAITVGNKTMYVGATPDGQLITIIPTPAVELFGKSGMGSAYKMTLTTLTPVKKVGW